MNKKLNKILMIVFIVMYLLSALSIVSNATGLDGIYQTGGDQKYTDIGGKIIGLVQYICYAAAVIILVYKGVGLMNKAPEAKAEAKKELIAYAIGAFILFGIGTMVRIIANIAMNRLF